MMASNAHSQIKIYRTEMMIMMTRGSKSNDNSELTDYFNFVETITV